MRKANLNQLAASVGDGIAAQMALKLTQLANSRIQRLVAVVMVALDYSLCRNLIANLALR